MSSSTIDSKEFQIKLKYKVGTHVRYFILDKFDFETIRDLNMIDKEKNIVKKKMEDRGDKWTNKADDFTELKNHLKEEDEKTYKFNIPLSKYYFTFDNFQGFINEKISLGSSKKKNFLKENEKYKDMLNTIKQIGKIKDLETPIKNLINNKVQVQANNHYFLNFNNKEELNGLFNMNIFSDNDNLSYNKYLYLCRFLWLIFNRNIYKYYINNSSTIENNEIIINLENEFSNNININKIILDNEEFKNKKKNDIINFPLITSYNNIETFLENIIYISDVFLDYKGRGQLSRDPFTKIVNIKITNPKNNSNFYIHEIFLKPRMTTADPRLHANETLQSFLFNKINHIFNNIESLYNEFEKENNFSNYKYLDENKSKFFIKSKKQEKTYIKEYFEFLQDNFNENEKYKNISESRLDRLIPNYNTDEGTKKIVKEYGKYILSDNYYENSNIDKIYSSLKSDTKTLSYIITYYNIFKILETFYLPYGCILNIKLFQEVFNEEDFTNEIKKTEEKIYIKIKSIKCIKLSEELVNQIFDNDEIIRPIYEIEFEEIPTFSSIEFYINLIDNLEPNKKLENIIDNYKKQYQSDTEREEEKTSIVKLNSEIALYKKYNNNIFSKNKNISSSKIYIDKKLNMLNLINKFNTIKNNYKILKKYDVENIKDVLMITDVFKELIKINELIDNTKTDNIKEIHDIKEINNIISNYYIKNFLFKTDTHLFINDKLAQIKKVNKRLLNNMNYEELKNNKLNDSKKEINKYLHVSKSKNIRLAIDNADSSYYMYLDIYIFFKNSLTDKISFKDHINYANNCIGRASILDTLLYNALGINYPRKYLENKLRKKTNSLNLTKKNSIIKSIPSNVESKKNPTNEISQKGGNNKNLTRKIISKQKNKTIKNLLHYYIN